MPGRAEVRVYIGLGGNLGRPQDSMARALQALEADPDTTVAGVSSVYRTPPWGRRDQPDFLNAAAELRCRLAPRSLLELCLETERGLHRVRRERWGPRLIDIDVLLYGDLAIHEEGMDIPHPRMLDRAFVLEPLAEIAPDLDLDGHRTAEWLGELDRSGIHRLATHPEWWRERS